MALGNILKEARIRKGLTPSAVAADTRMKVQLVQSIEQEDFSAFPATIYGKGFIKLFAECVEIDPAPLIDEYVNRLSSGNVSQPAPVPKSKKILIDTEPLIEKTAAQKQPITEKQPEEIIQQVAEQQETTPVPENKSVEEDLFSRVKSERNQPEKPLFHPEQKPAATPAPTQENIDIPVTPPVAPAAPITEKLPQKEITPIEKSAPSAPIEDSKPLYSPEPEKPIEEPAVKPETQPVKQEVIAEKEKIPAKEENKPVIENIINPPPVIEQEPEPIQQKPTPVIEQISDPEIVEQDIETVVEPEPIPVISQIQLDRNPEPAVKKTALSSSTPPMKKREANASLSLKKINLSDYNIKAISISAGILIAMILMISTIRRCSNNNNEKTESLNHTLQLAIPPADPYLE